MNTAEHIQSYIASHAEPKRSEMTALHDFIVGIMPDGKLWFLDGKNAEGKIISNPNVGYGSYQIQYADGTSKEFFQIGLSANSTGISVYIMGIEDKSELKRLFADKIGKASVTGYCIKFRHLHDIHMEVLGEAIRHRLMK